MSPYTHFGDVVMTADNGALDVLPAYGWFAVQASYPDPAVARHVLAQHGGDTAAFFARSISEATRVALLERYRAHWILATRASGVPTGASYRVVAHSRIQGAHLICFQSPAAQPQPC
jgi:hypothetical protein